MKVLLICFLLSISVCLDAQDELVFEALPSMPSGTTAFAYANDRQSLYAIGGTTFNKMYSASLQIYDQKINEWLKIPLKGLPQQNSSSAIYAHNYNGILLAGGITPSGNSARLVDEIRMIYPDRFNVEILGRLPEPAKNLGMAYDKSMLYMFGGSKAMRRSGNGPRSYRFSDKLYAYDLISGFVNELPNLPKAMETKGGIVQGNLYVFGGFSGKPESTVWQYNIEKRKWNELNHLDIPVSAYALSQYKHYFILVGDYQHGNQLIIYNTKTQRANYFKTNVRGRHMGASIVGDDLHVYGGQRSDHNSNITGQHYKISINKLLDNLN